ncbi:sugar kinase, partial [Rhizobium ruizarguesonis]
IGSVIGFTTYLMLVSRIGSSRAAYATVLFPIDPNQQRTVPRVMIGMTGKDTAILGAAALPIFSETNPRFDVLQKPLG